MDYIFEKNKLASDMEDAVENKFSQLRNTQEQGIDFQSTLVANFIDIKKDFDCVHRQTLFVFSAELQRSCDAWLSYIIGYSAIISFGISQKNELLNGHWISFTVVIKRHEITAQQPANENLITKRKIPNTALAELRGLAQDSTGSTEYAIKVKEIAAMVMDVIQQRFSSKRHPKLHALSNRFCSRSSWIRVTSDPKYEE
ncbi:unnamed protein product [Clavelina lepadiformis]|uniref:Uncharacterized protein n=1 Tax=Clavelina lepadiformis TaxID=159417 RepID=A0ABP0F0A3_CLALP